MGYNPLSPAPQVTTLLVTEELVVPASTMATPYPPHPVSYEGQSYPVTTSYPPVVTPDYFGPGWNDNAAGYQWEVQNLRRELEWAYTQLQSVDRDRSNAATALARLREAEARWYQSDMSAHREINDIKRQNSELTKMSEEAWQRMRGAEDQWHDALQAVDREKFNSQSAAQRVAAAEQEADRSKTTLVDQLRWAQNQLKRAQEEINRLRPAEAQFGAVTSEVEYLRSQTKHLRQLEDRFRSVCQETEMLRAQLLKQEHNIDRYTHQTESFYNSANSENTAIKEQLAQKKADLHALRARYQDAVDEIHHSHDQVRRAEQEISKLRHTADGLHDFVSEAIYLKHQYGDASKQLARMQGKLDGLAAENDDLAAQVDRLDLEVERLTLALGDEAHKEKFLSAALNEEIADNKTVRRQLNEEVVHQEYVATSAKNDAARLLNEANVKERELERLKNRISDTTGELDRYTNMYQEALNDVDRLKAALTEEITEHKYARGLAEQQKRKADLALEELERVGSDRSAAKLSKQLTEADSEIIELKNRLAETMAENQRLKSVKQPEYVTGEPRTVGYTRGQPVLRPGAMPDSPNYAYFGVEVSEGHYLKDTYGEGRAIPAVRVVNVGGPCAKAGLRPGDLVSSISGQEVSSLDDFNNIVSRVSPFTEVKMIFERDGRLLGTDVMTESTHKEPGGAPGTARSGGSDRRGRSGKPQPLWK